jgi:hypothetical protein
VPMYVLQISNITYVPTVDTDYRTINEDYSLCINVQNNVTEFPCSVSEQYAQGFDSSVSHSSSSAVGASAGVEVDYGKPDTAPQATPCHVAPITSVMVVRNRRVCVRIALYGPCPSFHTCTAPVVWLLVRRRTFGQWQGDFQCQHRVLVV